MRKIHKESCKRYITSEMLLLFNIRYNDNIYVNKIKQENHKYSKKFFNVIMKRKIVERKTVWILRINQIMKNYKVN